MEYAFGKMSIVEDYRVLLASAQEKKQKRRKTHLGEAVDTFHDGWRSSAGKQHMCSKHSQLLQRPTMPCRRAGIN
jgi:hypothetical protein